MSSRLSQEGRFVVSNDEKRPVCVTNSVIRELLDTLSAAGPDLGVTLRVSLGQPMAGEAWVTSFAQEGVKCVAVLMSEPARQDAQIDSTKGKNTHYARLLPSPDRQKELMERRRVAWIRSKVCPGDAEASRSLAEVQRELFNAFQPFVTNEVNRVAKDMGQSSTYQEDHAHLVSEAWDEFQLTLKRYSPGDLEVSRLFAQRLKYRLQHARQRIQTMRGTAAGVLAVSDKALGDSLSWRAASNHGNTDDLVKRRRWSKRKVASVAANADMLNPVCRLDAPTPGHESDEDKDQHELVVDVSGASTPATLEVAEAHDVLRSGLQRVLTAEQRLIIVCHYGVPAITKSEASRRVRNRQSGEPIDLKSIPAWPTPDELPTLLGCSDREVRRVLQDGLGRMLGFMKRHGLDASALRCESSHALS